MATQQHERSVPVAVAHDFGHFRLLELPPDLAALLDAPSPPPLSIKSSSLLSTGSSAPNSPPAYAVLCTPDKTFQLRQVQTSNSLFVTQPALDSHGNGPPIPVTRAIASCSATLELHPSDAPPRPSLDEALPLYDIVDGEVDVAGNGKSKAIVFSDLPFSSGQCEQTWHEVMAFEFAGSSFRPSANSTAQVWKSINAAAVAEGVKLDTQFLTADISKVVADEGYPAALAEAILRHVSTEGQDRDGPWSCLDRRTTIRFVGKTLLEARSNNDLYMTAEFLDQWKDSLPESWRQDVDLDTLEGLYDLPSSTSIAFKGRATTARETESATANPASSSRKWHAKFGRTRKR